MRASRWRVEWSPLGPVSADVVVLDQDGRAVGAWRAAWVGRGPVTLRAVPGATSKRTTAFIARFQWAAGAAPVDRAAEAAVRRRLAEARVRGDLGSRQ